jgi:membrane protein YqaA with SNARE-associated domain
MQVPTPDFTLNGLESWTYFFILVLLFSATPFPIFATEALVFMAGALADPLAVGLIAGVAASIGELTTYYLGLGSKKLITRKKHVGYRYKRAEKWFKRWGFWAVITFAFTPLPMDLLGLIAGSLQYDVKRFFLGTLIGKIPRFLLVAYAGAGLINVII